MLKIDKNKIQFSGSLIDYMERMARRPFSLFIFLVIVAAGLALYVFFSYQYLDVFENGANPADVYGRSFSPAKINEYRQIFSIMADREKKYNDANNAAYPDVFGKLTDEKK